MLNASQSRHTQSSSSAILARGSIAFATDDIFATVARLRAVASLLLIPETITISKLIDLDEDLRNRLRDNGAL